MRLIDADALIESIKNTADLGGWIGEALYQIKQVAIKYINSTPSIDIEPKRGEWISKGKRIYRCSNCGNYLDFDGVNAGRGDANFCPNCGAKMSNASNASNTLETLERGETE